MDNGCNVVTIYVEAIYRCIIRYNITKIIIDQKDNLLEKNNPKKVMFKIVKGNLNGMKLYKNKSINNLKNIVLN